MKFNNSRQRPIVAQVESSGTKIRRAMLVSTPKMRQFWVDSEHYLGKTWSLWRALQFRPRRHPLYERNLELKQFSATPYLLILAGIIGSAALLLPTFFSTLILVLVGGVYLLGIHQGTLAGLLWCLQINTQIERERNSGRYALCAAAPAGQIGTSWALGAACLHHDQSLEKRRGLNAECYVVALLLAIYFGAQAIDRYSAADFARLDTLPTQILLTCVFGFCLLVVFYCNHVGAILFGFLLGMLLPSLPATRRDARLWAIGAYGLLQMGTTIGAFSLSLLIWRAIGQSPLAAAPAGRTLTYLLQAGNGVLIFYLLREWALRRLFAAYLKHCGSDSGEWRTWLRENCEQGAP